MVRGWGCSEVNRALRSKPPLTAWPSHPYKHLRWPVHDPMAIQIIWQFKKAHFYLPAFGWKYTRPPGSNGVIHWLMYMWGLFERNLISSFRSHILSVTHQQDQTHLCTFRHHHQTDHKTACTGTQKETDTHTLTNRNTQTSALFLKNQQVYITGLIAARYREMSRYGSESVGVWNRLLRRLMELLSLSCGAVSTFKKLSFHRNEMCVCFLRE